MKKMIGAKHTALFAAVSALFLGPMATVTADTEKETGPQTMECVEIEAVAMLGIDTDCEIATNHHRNEQYPEAVFVCDDENAVCNDPANPCAVKGGLSGTITISGEDEDDDEMVIDFFAGAKCGFTLNDLNADLSVSEFQQFTARTNLGFFLNTTKMPEVPPGLDHPKPDFGLFLSDSGVANPIGYVSQRMALTGARKIPSGSKGALDMIGAPPERAVFGTLCGPGLKDALERIAGKTEGDHGEGDRDDDDDTDD